MRETKTKAMEQPYNVPLTQFFELKRPPFPQVLPAKDVYELPHVRAIAEMSEFAFQNGLYYAVIGSVGCGKTSALRFSCSRLAKRQVTVVTVTGGIWCFTEFLRQLLASLGVEFRQYQPATMVRMIQDRLLAIQQDGKKCIIMIDEAHLLKNDVFAQLHLLALRDECQSPLFSLMLCGQEELAEKLNTPQARPLMSRIAEGYSVPQIGRADFASYVDHHLAIAGAKDQIFDEMGLDTLWQTSNANLRSIGNNALAAMQFAANNGMRTVTAECVRKSKRNLWTNFDYSATSSAVSSIPDFSQGRRG